MMSDDKAEPWGFRGGVGYLWNLGSPEAIDLLRELHGQEGPDDVRARMYLCEALTYFGDARGLREAFDVLAASFTGLPESLDVALFKKETDLREQQREYAEDVLDRATSEAILAMVQPQIATGDISHRRAIILFIESVDELPPAVIKTVKAWASATNRPDSPTVRNEARKLLEAQGEIVPQS